MPETNPPLPVPRWLRPALLILITLVVYGPAVRYDFINLDDPTNLERNPYYQPLTLGNVLRVWQEPYKHLYAPLTYTVWGIEAYFAQDPNKPPTDGRGGFILPLRPGLFHAVNILLFVGSVLFVYGLLLELIPHPWAAFGGAALFALHPQQIETVVWVTSMKGLLSGFFTLLAALLFVRYLRLSEPPPGKKKTIPIAVRKQYRYTYAFGLLAYVLGLLAKSTAVILPLWLAILGYFLVKRKPRRLFWELVPWGTTAFAIMVVALNVYPGKGELAYQTLYDRLVIAADTLSWYVGKALAPWNLCFDYGRIPDVVFRSAVPWIWLVVLPVAAAVILWHYRATRNPWLLVPVALFITQLLPVSGIKPHDMELISSVCDRYVHLSLFGMALGFAYLWGRYPQPAVTGACAVVLLVLTAINIDYRAKWKDSPTLYESAIPTNPHSWMAYNNLGSYYESLNEYDKAEAYYHRLIELHPYIEPLNSLGVIQLKQGHNEKALEEFAHGLTYFPNAPMLRYNRGVALLLLGRKKEADEAFASAGGGPPRDEAEALPK